MSDTGNEALDKAIDEVQQMDIDELAAYLEGDDEDGDDSE